MNKIIIKSLMLSYLILNTCFLFSQNIYSAKVIQPDTIQTPSICIVSVNDNNHNIIVWEKEINDYIDYYNIYRESTEETDKWNNIGSTSQMVTAIFVDSTAESLKQSYRYKISAVDTCGNESSLSSMHKTVNLSVLKNINNAYSLIWDEYEGFQVKNYNIYRGKSVENLKLIASAASGNFNYNDDFITDEKIYYKIEAIAPYACNSNNLKSAQSIESISSSYSNYVSSGISAENKPIIKPNPFSENTTITFPNIEHSPYTLSIYDLTGAIVLQKVTNENTINLSKGKLNYGFYIIVLSGDHVYKGKIVITEY
jgi:hypothetical protein